MLASRKLGPLLCGLGTLLLLAGCFPALPSNGGGQTAFAGDRAVDPADVALLEGYRIEPVATGLTFPTGVAFDDAGGIYVIEAGYSYGEVFTEPRLLEISPDGNHRVIARGANPPWNGIDFANGAFYIAEGGVLEGGRILEVLQDGTITPLITDLPSLGDHHTNGPVVRNGWVYFGQGTATNAGVVGVDNADFGWLHRFPSFHDSPCEPITLNGQNFVTPNPLTDAEDEVLTGAFSPFGTPTQEGQVVGGTLPCSGAIMRVAVQDGTLELVAWGFRNPFGLAFDADGALYVTDNMYDVRGSRPVFGSGDLLWRVAPGVWHGWPDYHGNRPLTTHDQYQPHDGPPPGVLLAEHPNVPPAPVAVLEVHSSSNGLDVSRHPEFGYEGQVFIAQFGDLAPDVGKVLAPVGFKVIRVDPLDGTVHDFAINRDPSGPASKTGGGGLERPVATRFSPDGRALYVVDFGVMTVGENGPQPHPRTGVLWRITREEVP